mmetsp:Transcript_2592/g.8070  ORF Transcript_2592/g.8070 Transcript_2592/m.8070 type:complete len:217 (+) Transcript_2592:77-727(+)
MCTPRRGSRLDWLAGVPRQHVVDVELKALDDDLSVLSDAGLDLVARGLADEGYPLDAVVVLEGQGVSLVVLGALALEDVGDLGFPFPDVVLEDLERERPRVAPLVRVELASERILLELGHFLLALLPHPRQHFLQLLVILAEPTQRRLEVVVLRPQSLFCCPQSLFLRLAHAWSHRRQRRAPGGPSRHRRDNGQQEQRQHLLLLRGVLLSRGGPGR